MEYSTTLYVASCVHIRVTTYYNRVDLSRCSSQAVQFIWWLLSGLEKLWRGFPPQANQLQSTKIGHSFSNTNSMHTVTGFSLWTRYAYIRSCLLFLALLKRGKERKTSKFVDSTILFETFLRKVSGKTEQLRTIRSEIAAVAEQELPNILSSSRNSPDVRNF